MGQNESCMSLPPSETKHFPTQKFKDVYYLGKELGSGSFASVRTCHRKSDGEAFAVKIMNKNFLTDKELLNLQQEIEILTRLKHPNIISLIDVFDDGKHVFLVLELCKKKDLFEYLLEAPQNRFSEEKAARILYDLANVLEYLHTHNVIHRDLKPENVLFDLDGNLKLTDFGLAHYEELELDEDSKKDADSKGSKDDEEEEETKEEVDTESSEEEEDESEDDEDESVRYDEITMKTCCGTPHYVAPEVICQQAYTYKCDLWSLGVILFIMLGGYQPFEADSLPAIYTLIACGKYKFDARRWSVVSDEAMDLVRKLLTVDPQKRLDWNDVKQHPWICRYIELEK
eukprot:CAMPEP_0197072082 /NCGR_PEP_ID=MMETSP1384-20130603/209917_1 /TAXON_ID=29189 /ORGANISM="Ammonia sp." /LENGTH=342 /DNA_ID=CAMNT_0042510895 /DNA_START=119 /DNA_END=1147 /DNA_ORIENTATION=-